MLWAQRGATLIEAFLFKLFHFKHPEGKKLLNKQNNQASWLRGNMGALKALNSLDPSATQE